MLVCIAMSECAYEVIRDKASISSLLKLIHLMPATQKHSTAAEAEADEELQTDLQSGEAIDLQRREYST